MILGIGKMDGNLLAEEREARGQVLQVDLGDAVLYGGGKHGHRDGLGPVSGCLDQPVEAVY